MVLWEESFIQAYNSLINTFRKKRGNMNLGIETVTAQPLFSERENASFLEIRAGKTVVVLGEVTSDERIVSPNESKV